MWIDGKKVEVPKWKLMHQLLPTKRYYRRVNKFYSTLSEFAHSDFAAIAKDWKRQLSRKKEAFVFHQFKKSFVGEALASPLNLLITLTLTEVFREELGEDFRNKVIDLAKGKVLEWEAEGFLRD